jgi:hypothetical protein
MVPTKAFKPSPTEGPTTPTPTKATKAPMKIKPSPTGRPTTPKPTKVLTKRKPC